MDNKIKKNVAILYIATGRYTVFWDYFYKSAEKYLLPDCNKHYILFTDSLDLLYQYSENPKVSVIKKESLKWPYSTLMRFKLFLSVSHILEKYEFTFYFNANTEFLSYVTKSDLLPLKSDEKLSLCLQPHMFHLNKNEYTYDRNPESTAYIPYNQGNYYFTGALNGGKTKDYLEMCEVLNKNTEIDLKNNTIALWHDESHLNNFALNRKDIKTLPPYFTRGETEYWKNSSKLMFSDKNHHRFGGHSYLRGETDNKITQAEWKKPNVKTKQVIKFRFKQYFKSFFL